MRFFIDQILVLLFNSVLFKSFEKEFDIFVEYRVQDIKKLTNIKQWKFMETKHNPAK